jgi:hypothetical protein
LTTEPDEKDETAPIELPNPSAFAVPPPQTSSVEASVSSETASLDGPPTDAASATDTQPRPTLIARPVNGAQRDVLFVPLAVSIGDGFKFGCGFFLAMVLALLVVVVLLALLFVVTSLFGLNLPVAR